MHLSIVRFFRLMHRVFLIRTEGRSYQFAVQLTSFIQIEVSASCIWTVRRIILVNAQCVWIVQHVILEIPRGFACPTCGSGQFPEGLDYLSIIL